VEKAVALNPYDADNLGTLGMNLAFSGLWDEGTAFAEKAIKLMGPAAQPYCGGRLRSDTGSEGNTRKPTKGFSDLTKKGFGFRISTSLTPSRSSDGSTRPRRMSRRF
jgi:hypothetical protein